jgi:formamidopyrimidine-DNA glycosylase
MPELPEVETVVRGLASRLAGCVIRRASFFSRLVVREDSPALAAWLAGRRIERVERRGKFVVLRLDRGALSIHLGMTGKLLLDGIEGRHTRALFALDGGLLVYDDARQFGRIEYGDPEPGRLSRLGPDALRSSEEEFLAALHRRRGRIKSVLLNQSVIAGLGNIYVDESLFAARIHPRAQVWRLSGQRLRVLRRAMARVLELAIALGGSSISDYVDVEGRRGSFQNEHRVYGRSGQPCTVCGRRIRRIEVAQRGTYYCPRCQKI